MTERITIQRLSHEGRGIAQIEGKTIFIENALPGETVEITAPQKKSKILEAKATAIIDPSVMRATPPCPVFDRCGGCSMQHLSIEAQQSHKQQVLRENLLHFGKTSTTLHHPVQPSQWLDPLTANALGYRRKARLGVRYVAKKSQVLVGFRERNGRFLVDTNECAILDPRIGNQIGALKQLLFSLEAKEEIAQIEVAISDDTVALVFRNLSPLNQQDQDALIHFGQAHQYWIFLQPKGPDSIKRIWPQEGEALLSYDLPTFDLRLYFSPLDFTQINHALNLKMVERALELLEPQSQDRVLDAFCGIGNFSLPIARHAGFVLGVEDDAAMVEKATENAKRNHCHQAQFITANLFEASEFKRFSMHTFDKILLDPPRAGAEVFIREFLALPHQHIKKIVYISCNPATLARDAGILVNQHGYEMIAAGIMDMFPHTSHVESMAVFQKT